VTLADLTWVSNVGPGTVITIAGFLAILYQLRGLVAGEQKERISALEHKVDELKHDLAVANEWKARYEEARQYTAPELATRLEATLHAVAEQLSILVALSERQIQMLDPDGTSVPRRHTGFRRSYDPKE
jgi:hypothetical protein